MGLQYILAASIPEPQNPRIQSYLFQPLLACNGHVHAVIDCTQIWYVFFTKGVWRTHALQGSRGLQTGASRPLCVVGIAPGSVIAELVLVPGNHAEQLEGPATLPACVDV